MTARTSSASDALEGCAGLSARELTELLSLLDASDVVELELSFGASHLSLTRSASAHAGAAPPASAEPSTLVVESPLVGIFHTQLQTDDAVEHATPIGTIESLGIQTTVDAPANGTVEEILVADGTPVEYGQPLLVLHRT